MIYETKEALNAPNLQMSESALFCKSDPGWVGPDIQMAFISAVEVVQAVEKDKGCSGSD